MTYSEAKSAEYPPQEENQLLTEFAAELLARRTFAVVGDIRESWNDWIGNRQETREERMEPFVTHAANLAAVGMLTWPQKETPGIGWTVQKPGEYRGMNAAPALDRITLFGQDAGKAISYFRACRTTDQPCRLEWAFAPKMD
ncbi:hypothetical protein [Arthrobacter sp. UYCo732]|uniref:hypothetical protein n=1 Tax=Arthrobacter sp. UYCo732 TaxID=3156336 RepID=UPI0033982D19